MAENENEYKNEAKTEEWRLVMREHVLRSLEKLHVSLWSEEVCKRHPEVLTNKDIRAKVRYYCRMSGNLICWTCVPLFSRECGGGVSAPAYKAT